MDFPLGDTMVLQEQLCETGTPIKRNPKYTTTIYQLNLGTPKEVEKHQIRSYQVGRSSDVPLYPVEEKVVLLVGESGSGKSATINSIANFVYGVKADSKRRFQLVDEIPDEDENEEDLSVTEWVTAYTLHYQKGFKLGYTLTIVDTPGYGTGRDTEITSLMKAFFGDECHGIGCEYLSAVCFVTKSTETRLLPAKVVIFNALLDLFGKDLADNILHIFTFAGNSKKTKDPKDREDPKVLKVVKKKKEIPLKHWYLIENGENGGEEAFANTTDSLCDLLGELGTMMDTSVSKTKEALEERDRLQNNIKCLQELFVDSYFKLDVLNVYKEVLGLAQKDREKINQVAVYERVKIRFENVNGRNAINCTQCESTCHYPCRVPAYVLNWACHIVRFGKCTLCNCSWTQHEISTSHYERMLVLKGKNLEDILQKYKGNKERELEAQECIKRIEDELQTTKGKMKDRVKSILDSIKRLEEIALRPCTLNETNLIDQEIKSVEDAAHPRWEERVKILEDLKKEQF